MGHVHSEIRYRLKPKKVRKLTFGVHAEFSFIFCVVFVIRK